MEPRLKACSFSASIRHAYSVSKSTIAKIHGVVLLPDTARLLVVRKLVAKLVTCGHSAFQSVLPPLLLANCLGVSSVLAFRRSLNVGQFVGMNTTFNLHATLDRLIFLEY